MKREQRPVVRQEDPLTALLRSVCFCFSLSLSLSDFFSPLRVFSACLNNWFDWPRNASCFLIVPVSILDLAVYLACLKYTLPPDPLPYLVGGWPD